MRTIVAFLLLITAKSLAGQTQERLPPSSGPVAKYSNLIFTVGKLEASVAFYRDLIGLEVLSLRRGSPNDKVVGPYVAKVSGSPPAVVFSSAILRLPETGFNLLMTEFGNVDRIRREANLRDTNATMLVLTVRDLDRPYGALKKAGARIVTPGGAPLELPDHSRGVVVRDVDGFLVQLVQPAHMPATDRVAGQNILSAHIRLTVNSLHATAAFYSNVLGFDVSPASARTSDPYVQSLLNLPRTRWQISTGGLPGTRRSFEFIEYVGGKNPSPFKSLRDPGTPAFSMGVRNVDKLLAAMKTNGVVIISDGAEPALSPNGGRNVFVRDPSGFFLELEGPTEH
jgi:catechol 2,3-dioxygenase-like lactoylglutathione lyase family enzyme